ncbi:hypothetical protein BDQ17DRAFT_1370377 [Cyathus striatus]|nr:hypothetical protein BDQ17DRAFT_1370377 [Cyathus striatus]
MFGLFFPWASCNWTLHHAYIYFLIPLSHSFCSPSLLVLTDSNILLLDTHPRFR